MITFLTLHSSVTRFFFTEKKLDECFGHTQGIQNNLLISKSLLPSLEFCFFVPSLERSGGLDIEKGSISGV